MTDVTDREELLLLGEIAAEAAHELRNALAVISGSASLLKAASLAAPEAAHVAKIDRNARLAQSVLDALLSLARGDAVRGAPVALSAVMAAAREEVAGDLAYEDDVAEVSVRGSDVLLARMFRVLYDNATQAGAKRITTRARESNGTVTIDITDDGPGIPDEIRATLFDPLVTTKPSGTGLGLALARRIARAHGGDVVLGAPGAHFIITLRA